MVADVDVLHPLVHFGAVYESNAGLIVEEERGGVCRRVANFSEEITKPYDLLCGSQAAIYSASVVLVAITLCF